MRVIEFWSRTAGKLSSTMLCVDDDGEPVGTWVGADDVGDSVVGAMLVGELVTGE